MKRFYSDRNREKVPLTSPRALSRESPRRKFHYGAFLLLLPVGVAACAPIGLIGDATHGELGHVDFTFQAGCWFGCRADRRLVVGASEELGVTGPANDPGVVAVSQDSSIISVGVADRRCSCQQVTGSSGYATPGSDSGACPAGTDKTCLNLFPIKATGSGDTRIELHGLDGSLIDRVLLRARVPSSAAFTISVGPPDHLVSGMALVAGVDGVVSVSLVDESGGGLWAPLDGVHWTSSNFDAIALYTYGAQSSAIDSGTLVGFRTGAAGPSEIKLRTDGFVAELELSVQ